MSVALKLETEFDQMTCGDCGIVFFMPASFRQERLSDHRNWYCPNGHPRHYPGKSREELLQERLTAALSRENEERARANELAKTVARQSKRAQAGLCSCCNRTFQNLKRHMATKHKVKP